MKSRLYLYAFCKEVMTFLLLVLVFGFLLIVVGSELSYIDDNYSVILMIISILIFFTTIVSGTLAVKHWKYSWNEEKISYQTGFFTVKETIIPIMRVMQISTAKNPLLNKWGLIEVIIITTTETHTLLPITIDECEIFKNAIIEKLSVSGETDD